MQTAKEQLIITIIGIILVLLFLGVLFLVAVVYYNNKRRQMARDWLRRMPRTCT